MRSEGLGKRGRTDAQLWQIAMGMRQIDGTRLKKPPSGGRFMWLVGEVRLPDRQPICEIVCEFAEDERLVWFEVSLDGRALVCQSDPLRLTTGRIDDQRGRLPCSPIVIEDARSDGAFAGEVVKLLSQRHQPPFVEARALALRALGASES